MPRTRDTGGKGLIAELVRVEEEGGLRNSLIFVEAFPGCGT